MTTSFDVEPVTRVVLSDRDPISRHVISSVLHESAALDVVGISDDPDELAKWSSRQVDVAVLSLCPRETADPAASTLIRRGMRVLLLGTDWSRQRLDAAASGGVAGFLLKDTQVLGLVTAVRAVAAGHTVLSPELHGYYRPPAGPAPGAAPAAPDRARAVGQLTEREREVLTLLAEGITTAEAAARLHVSRATVKSHVSHALAKLGARNRVEAVLMMRATLDGRDQPQRPAAPRGRDGVTRGPRWRMAIEPPPGGVAPARR